MQRLPLPGIASPVKSGPALASVTLDQRWAHLRDGDFVVIDKERDVMPFANDPDRERRLWDATRELLNQALSVVRQSRGQWVTELALDRPRRHIRVKDDVVGHRPGQARSA